MRIFLLAAVFVPAAAVVAFGQSRHEVPTGGSAFSDWRTDKPGVRRHIRPKDLPRPYASPSARNASRVVKRPGGAAPQVPAGFAVSVFADGLEGPRAMQVAPNGDVFVAESRAGQIRVLRPAEGAGTPAQIEIFARGLNRPFGIAFYPRGDSPEWVYVATTDSVVRFPYRAADLTARDKPEVVVRSLPTGGHWTRDIAFSKDGTKMFVSVGSASNTAESMAKRDLASARKWEAERMVGAAWGAETERAAVLVFDPDGNNRRLYATGIRNCVGLAVQPATGDLWCSTNERDGLGDDLVPDYVTRVKEGGFYGWPWYYIGRNEDPAHAGERLDLRDKITVPDVLIQSHSASLQMAFYDGSQFPRDYRGDAFAAQHGSWNRAKRTGYKLIRVIVKDGAPTGEYEDFMTGFVVNDDDVWGRPVGVAVAKDGALLVSDDGSNTIWRVSYEGR